MVHIRCIAHPITRARLNAAILTVLLLFSGSPVKSADAGGTSMSLATTRLKIFQGSIQTSVRDLPLKTAIEGELKPADVHSYRFSVEAGQYFRVVVLQEGIDVVVELIGPDGKQIIAVDSPNGITGPEPVSSIAEASGVYRVDVKALDAKAAPGRYEIKLEELRESTANDLKTIAAEKALAEAERLRSRETEESLRMAIEKYEEALPTLRAIEDRSREAETLSVVGFCYRLLGESQKALEYYNQALPLRRAVKDRAGEANTLNNMGSAYLSLGEIQQALKYYEEALVLWRAARDSREARTLTVVGTIYRIIGDHEGALARFQSALALERSAGDQLGEVETFLAIGQLHWQLGDNQKALEFYMEALSIARSIKSRAHESAILGVAGLAYWSLGDSEKALQYYNEALRVAGTAQAQSDAYLKIGSLYASLGKQADALVNLERALSLQRGLGNRHQEISTLLIIARVERDIGHFGKARAYIELALNTIESIRSTFTNFDFRTSYLADRQSAYEFYIDLLMRMDRAEPSLGFNAAALEASERARARGLLEILTEASADIRQGVDPELLAQERSLRQQLNAKAERLTRLLLAKVSPAQETAARGEVESLLKQSQQLESEIRTKSPRYAALTQPQPLSPDKIQQLLDNDTLLLEYALGTERSYLWAVTTKSIVSFELPKKAEIENAARVAVNLLVKKADGLTPDALNWLSQTLLGPVAKELGHKRLIIISHGALQYVPFGALPDPGIEQKPKLSADLPTATESKFQPLILDHEIISLPSASVIGVLRQEHSTNKVAPNKLVVFADPVFARDDRRVKFRKGKQSENLNSNSDAIATKSDLERSAEDLKITNFSRLPLSRKEAELIMSRAPTRQSRALLDFDASLKAAANSDLKNYQVIHFATHTLLDSEHPELSGIVLSLVDDQGRPQDGFLRLNEIYNLRLNADLVVLSGCQTALGKEVKGEGLISLTRGFMYAGAPRVIASLWKVSDASTAELMDDFYRNMFTNHMRPAAALRAAQISMLNKKQWSAPYHWAGFVFQGEWK